MGDPRQYILLAVAVFVPLFLIVKRWERGLLAWVCFTLGINLFDTTIILNLPAARIVGLMLIPQALQNLSPISRSLPGRTLIIQYVYLVLLGVVFGFILPWPGGGYDRAFNQLAHGRTVIYLIRTAADISLAFFVARQIIKWPRPDKVLRYILAGTSAAALAAILEFMTRIDWYGMITGLRALELEYRMRGFNYEPRGLGLMTAQGMLLAVLLFSRRRLWRSYGLIVINAVGLFLSGSTSALVAAVAGASAFLLLGRRARLFIVGIVMVGALILIPIINLRTDYIRTFQENLTYRLTTARFSESPSNVFEELAFRMEIYDGPALLFLVSNPIYLVIGTGPGLIPLPATAYIPSSADNSWINAGLNCPPMMGGLLEISNGGIVGFMCWIIICLSSLRAFKKLTQIRPLEAKMWQTARGAFIVVAVVFFLQVSGLSAIWPVFIGMGIGAACLTQVPRPVPLAIQTMIKCRKRI
ncbi:MAG: hypothetical protein WC381_03720 [Kiritimatiellia bacterium]|jgi:hypothetical protein